MEGLAMNNPIDANDISIDDLDSITFFEHFDAPIAELFDDPEALDINNDA
jgi:hypothetical protein